ncbi:2-hydroxychromene-2-carboxylate isomerase [Pseudorhodoferax sp. Leaf267]|uniref:2-hydroxychromene-2-carboxylate isomerase n=1 Tax=Pseudorhodoferax sp. Leaf267 TaxID=1736316 RepID=UPI0006F34643|nr:2-hydroxychromene-2-carboxylate isomerase [Pseudorhodoferax sp. Leaf267]KQP23466.1 hypothetical protein ASF43_06300 [Pseudorhodoferax sp. Leaf267]
MPELEFHFDFLSPYGYFASQGVEALAARHDRLVDWHPMLLGITVMKVMGLKPLLETPLKGDYIRRDVARLARMLDLPLGRELERPPRSSLVPARAVCWAKHYAPHAVPELVHALYAALWRHGIDIDAPDDLTQVALPPSLDAGTLVDASKSKEAADLLRQSVENSVARGVFGSPTVLIDGEPFWGFDRLDQAERWLATGGW